MWLKISFAKDKSFTQKDVKEISIKEGEEGAFYIEFCKSDGYKGKTMLRDYASMVFGKQREIRENP